MTKPNKSIAQIFLLPAFYLARKANAQISFDFKPPVSQTDPAILMTNTLKWMLGVAGSIALLALIISGIMYMISTGNVSKAMKAKKNFLWILAGLILILISYSILVILDSVFIS